MDQLMYAPLPTAAIRIRELRVPDEQHVTEEGTTTKNGEGGLWGDLAM